MVYDYMQEKQTCHYHLKSCTINLWIFIQFNISAVLQSSPSTKLLLHCNTISYDSTLALHGLAWSLPMKFMYHSIWDNLLLIMIGISTIINFVVAYTWAHPLFW